MAEECHATRCLLISLPAVSVTPGFGIRKASLVKDVTLEDWVEPHKRDWSLVVRGGDYLDAKTQHREPI